MSPEVRSQVEVEAESFGADFALVRLFTRVNQLVAFKLRVVKKLLLTTFDAADKHTLTVGHLVLAERAVVWELLKTVLYMALIDAGTWLHPFHMVVTFRVI